MATQLCNAGVIVTQPITNIIQIATIGPQGPQGPQGNALSYITTGSVSASVNIGVNSFQVTSGSSTYLYINSSGNVGIGTVTPSARLEVSGSDVIINSVNIGRGGGNISTNTRFGTDALLTNTTGIDNTAIGRDSLRQNTTGQYNTAIGKEALRNNSSGIYNTAIGREALRQNTTGQYNTAIGNEALRNNITGRYNTAIGREALLNNITGSDNTAIGNEALLNNTEGEYNTAIGRKALSYVIGFEQDANTAIGSSAGSYLSNTNPLKEVKYSVFIGADTKANADSQENQIVIGYGAESLGSNTVVLGNGEIQKTILRGNVGIGTTSPSAQLHISGATADKLLIVDTPSISGSLFVSGSGRVGIQQSNPTDHIHITSNPAATQYIRIDAARISNSPLRYVPASPAKEIYGNTEDDYALGTPDYWMEILLNGGVVLIPCYSPEPG